MKTAIMALLGAIIVLGIFVLGVMAVITFGYAVGILITAIPFLNGFLVGETSINADNIPVYTAWLAVAAAMFSLSNIKLTIGASKPVATTEVLSRTISK